MEATIGGTKRHLLELCAGLRAAGWDVEVACPRVRAEALGDVSFWDDLGAAGIPAHEVPMRRAPANRTNAAAIVRLARMIREGGYDVVHAQSSIGGALARPAALLAGIGSPRSRSRVVYTPHGFAFLAPGSRAKQRLFLHVERALGRYTDRLIAVSPTEAGAAVAHRIVPPHRVETIPNGIVAAGFPDREDKEGVVEVRRRLGWTDVPVVGTLARMTAQKDPFTWLRVAARVARERPDVRFAWIWGGGELEQAVYEETDRLGLRSRLDFLGYRADARAVIGALDLFLLTSAFEGLPYSLIEALAAGVPTVATAVVGTADIVRHGETGLLAPAGDAAALADAVLRLLSDPAQARSLAAAGRADVLSRFSVDRMVARTAALYEQVLREAGEAGGLPLPQREG
jgi:glycosyltransferase involved in cell wall biosynthesis